MPCVDNQAGTTRSHRGFRTVLVQDTRGPPHFKPAIFSVKKALCIVCLASFLVLVLEEKSVTCTVLLSYIT